MRRIQRVMLVSGLIGLGASVSSCAGSPLMINALDCSAFIPNSYREPVADVPPPESNLIGDWLIVADGRSGRLDEANGRTKALIEIAEGCQQEQAKLTRKKFLGLFWR